jgi:hypothetical protein
MTMDIVAVIISLKVQNPLDAPIAEIVIKQGKFLNVYKAIKE